jgi:hypothetical protein
MLVERRRATGGAAVTPGRRLRRIPVTIDCTYGGSTYRIAEAIRDRASVRPMERDGIACGDCHRAIRKYASYLQTATLNLHPACAIRRGLLVVVGRSETTVPAAALRLLAAACLAAGLFAVGPKSYGWALVWLIGA